MQIITSPKMFYEKIITPKKSLCKFKIDLVLLISICIFLVLKSTLGRKPETGFVDI